MLEESESYRVFADILRGFLRPGVGPFDVSDNLADLGLDSFSTIGLLVQLEDTFGVELPDDRLTVETFATPGSLWSVITELAHPSVIDSKSGRP